MTRTGVGLRGPHRKELSGQSIKPRTQIHASSDVSSSGAPEGRAPPMRGREGTGRVGHRSPCSCVRRRGAAAATVLVSIVTQQQAQGSPVNQSAATVVAGAGAGGHGAAAPPRRSVARSHPTGSEQRRWQRPR